MLNKINSENDLIVNSKKEIIEKKDTEIKLLDEVIQDFAPEILGFYLYREDEAEEQQVKTGLLHENRISGIMLKKHLQGQNKVSTAEVEAEYERYFRDVARATMSMY